MKIVFLTDGPARWVQLRKQVIMLKHTTPRAMATAGRVSGLVIQALRHIGQRHVDGAIVARLQKRLSDDDRKQLLQDIRFAPAWIAAILRRVAGRRGSDRMNAFLRLSAERRRLLCEEGQQRLGLTPASIEKDFWVCWTLRELFGLPQWGEYLTFTGGTSLSKGGRLTPADEEEDPDDKTPHRKFREDLEKRKLAFLGR